MGNIHPASVSFIKEALCFILPRVNPEKIPREGEWRSDFPRHRAWGVVLYSLFSQGKSQEPTLEG